MEGGRQIEWGSMLTCLSPTLTYQKERIFKFPNAGEIEITQDITFISGTIWDASVILSFYLDSLGRSFFDGKVVLELGSGTALPSIVAARLGATVVCTELESSAKCTLESLEANLTSNSYVVIPLEWSEDLGAKNPEEQRVMADADILLGADIIYNEHHFVDLLVTVKWFFSQSKHDKKKRIQFFMSYEQRRKNVERFFDLASEWGINFEEKDLFFPNSCKDSENEIRIHLYHAKGGV